MVASVYINNADEHKTTLVARFPWRRYFARVVDHGVYSIAWWCIAVFGFHWNIFDLTLKNIVIPLVIQFLLESFFLCLFGRTPGKALLGIVVSDKIGRKPTFRQAFFRTCRILFYGYGLFIPIYSAYRMYKSYRECNDFGLATWDKKAELISILKDKRATRLVGFALFNGLHVLIIALFLSIIFMPQYRGDITSAQFNYNIERYARFHGMLLRNDSLAVTPSFRSPPTLNIVETNGVVEEISFEIIDGRFSDVWGLEHWIRAYVISFVGAQESANLWNIYFSRDSLLVELFPDGLWFGWVHRSHRHVFHGVEIIYQFEVDGLTDWINFSRDSVINARFSMRKTYIDF